MNGAHQCWLAGSGFIVGASVGSFLNVCVWRIPRGASVIRPASRCPGCSTTIQARDNVPIVSWLALKGRCRSCRCPISTRYPMVEGLVGLLFAAVVFSQCAIGADDLFDRGPLNVLGRIAYLWSLVALLVTSTLIEYDRVQAPNPFRMEPGSSVLAPTRSVTTTFGTVSVAILCLAMLGDPLAMALNLGLLAVLASALRSR